MSALLDIRGLTLHRGGRAILSDVRLRVDAGQSHVLLGANGAGKSTLAYAVMGCAAYEPSAGRVYFDGTDVTDLPIHERARRGLALAWQEPARFEGLTVADYLGIGGRLDPAACLAQVGLAPGDYLHRGLDRTLSGGERKRIELAGVLALQPRLAILDEPSAGIDFLSEREIQRVIEALRQGGAVLLITHQEALAAGADRASQLCGGRIVCAGDPADVIAAYRSRRCRRCDGEVCHDG
jgi:Fe-S cluster assembly ATP-binding protein